MQPHEQLTDQCFEYYTLLSGNFDYAKNKCESHKKEFIILLYSLRQIFKSLFNC